MIYCGFSSESSRLHPSEPLSDVGQMQCKRGTPLQAIFETCVIFIDPYTARASRSSRTVCRVQRGARVTLRRLQPKKIAVLIARLYSRRHDEVERILHQNSTPRAHLAVVQWMRRSHSGAELNFTAIMTSEFKIK